MSDITIVIPVKNPPSINDFISGNLFYLISYDVIVIDSGGGNALRDYATIYIEEDMSMVAARNIGYQLAETKYIVNLDVDTIIPANFIQEAINQLEQNDNMGAVSILHTHGGNIIPHLTFGCSVWKTDVLIKFYDYNPARIPNSQIVCLNPSSENKHYVVVGDSYYCECMYMWKKIMENGYYIGFIPEIPLCIHMK